MRSVFATAPTHPGSAPFLRAWPAALRAALLGVAVIATQAASLLLAAPAVAADKALIAVVEIEGKLAARKHVLAPMGGKSHEATLTDVTHAIESVLEDSDVKGLLIRLREAELSVAQVEEIGRSIQKVRAAGRKVHLYAYGYGTPELVLGSFTDEVIAQAGGGVSLPGVYMEEMFLADALGWMGVKADMVQIGDYKGAAEQMANSKPSEPWNQNINQLLDSVYERVRAQVKAGRKLDDARLDKAMEASWEGSAEDAKAAGLIDTVLDLPELSDHLKKAYGEIRWGDNILEHDAKGADLSNPFTMLKSLMEKPDLAPKRPTIAVLHIDGAIVDGDSTSGGFLGGEGSVGSLTVRRALGAIESNDLIKGLVIRIDSPGGSAIASEVIWQGVRRVADKGKPVWISVGGMAASGGYYILSAGDRVYITPSSIVGSIGVVGGKIAMQGLYDKLQVNVVGRARGPRAAMMASTPWTAEQRGYVRAAMQKTYDLFTRRVAAGRKGIDLAKTAEGRLFLGQKAIDLKMADKIGGLDDALTDLAAELNLAPGTYDVLDYPEPMSFAEIIEKMLGAGGMGAASPIGGAGRAAPLAGLAPLAGVAREVLGEQAWAALRPQLQALLELRKEPVLLVSPRAIYLK